MVFPYAPEHAALSREVGRTTPITTQETVKNTTQETAKNTTQEKIVALLRAEPTITWLGLAERLHITPNGIRYHLSRLRADGAIRHVGPTKAGRWEVLGGISGGLPAGEVTSPVTGEVAREVARAWGTAPRKKTGKDNKAKPRKKTKEKTL